MRKILSVVILVVLAYFGLDQSGTIGALQGESPAGGELRLDTSRLGRGSGADEIRAAFESRANDLQIGGYGTVARVLPDDNEGSRHQKFLLEIPGGQTVLVAHNIDLAPRIERLREGDRVDFYGVYEWNSRGGVIHWTHHDPRGKHIPGWLEHDGRRYE